MKNKTIKLEKSIQISWQAYEVREEINIPIDEKDLSFEDKKEIYLAIFNASHKIAKLYDLNTEKILKERLEEIEKELKTRKAMRKNVVILKYENNI